MKKPSRQYVWRHNGLRGGIGMIRAILNNIKTAPSTTFNAKFFADEMLQILPALEGAMVTRVDP